MGQNDPVRKRERQRSGALLLCLIGLAFVVTNLTGWLETWFRELGWDWKMRPWELAGVIGLFLAIGGFVIWLPDGKPEPPSERYPGD
jgi:hypothetical protein